MNQAATTPNDLQALRVLVVDDEADIRVGIRKLLGGLGVEARVAEDGQQALEMLADEPADLVLTDLNMPRLGGVELLAAIKERRPETAVMILTGFGTVQSAVSCLQGGAAHFITKPFDNDELLRLTERVGRRILAGRTAPAKLDGMIAEDPAMRRVVELVERVAQSPLPVLVEGESGTGKEVVARLIHDRSPVAKKPFQAVNAAALPDSLLESELFGHMQGSFTGADHDREGIFSTARGGTVFLDEVASMSPSFQSKLLRVLQEKVVRPLGSSADRPVDFRLVAASNKDLAALIAAGDFREDLFYRLGVVRIHLPRLAERPLDILPLANLFLRRAAATCLGGGAAVPELTPGAVDALTAHTWPGNVRELENAINRAVIVAFDGRILPHHLGLEDRAWSERQAAPDDELQYAEGKQLAIERFQRDFVRRALELTRGNISQAAERCGMTRAALQRILRQHGIDRDDFR
jgi:DNA-binding NtrC family response regulator